MTNDTITATSPDDEHGPKPCPHCGHCPTCGRGPTHPAYPAYPVVYPYVQPYWPPWQTITTPQQPQVIPFNAPFPTTTWISVGATDGASTVSWTSGTPWPPSITPQ